MKKHKILKGVLIGTAVVLILLAVHFIRNYIIIKNILDKQAKLESCTNFYYVTESYTAKENKLESVTRRYHKYGKNKLELEVDGNKKMILWRDAETQEEIFVIPQALQAIISKTETSPWFTIPFSIDNEFANWLVLSTIITNDNIDGKECYKINLNGAKFFISKEEGTVLRSMNGTIKIEGKEYYNIIDYKDWKFNEVKDEDVTRPDLTEYEVKYSEE